MVNFAGLEFIFRFLPIFLIVYYLVPTRFRDIILLLGSIIFYAVGEPIFILILIATIGVNYYFGLRLWESGRAYEMRAWQKQKNKKYLIAILIFDVGLLVLFKGLSLFLSNTLLPLKISLNLFTTVSFQMNSLLPLGISFYIFKMISFQIDLYKGQIREKITMKNTALYFVMFPQVISGPIMRYEEGGFGLERNHSLEQFEEGLKYFILGLGMKVLLADRLSIFWHDMQMIGFSSISTPLAWLGMVAYSLQLYFDFWGYSLMAAGIGVMLGFEFILNFNHPYASKSISEFYRRWHVSLGNWFRDYIYFPMGGNQRSMGRIVVNLLVVWVITGIWHGNGLNFLIWGVILGLLIVSEKLFMGAFLKKVPMMGRIYVILLIPLTWMIFAITDLSQLSIYFGRLFPFLGGTSTYVNQQDFLNYLSNYGVFLGVGIILCIPSIFEMYEKYKKNIIVTLLLFVIFWFSIYFLVSSNSNPFMYLQF